MNTNRNKFLYHMISTRLIVANIKIKKFFPATKKKAFSGYLSLLSGIKREK